MEASQKLFLERTAYNVRVSSLVSTTEAGSGHPTTCLSAADIGAVLFFYAMQFDPQHHTNPNNDRFILSKGHAAPLLYALYKELGLVSEQELMSLRTFDSRLEGHPTPRFNYSEAATGSLGQGLSIGAGIALSAKMDKRTFKTYVLMGDSEVAEGSVWEAAQLAAHYKLDNLIAILDVNKLGQSTETMEGYHLERYEAMFGAFGWHTITINGHNIQEIAQAFDTAKKVTNKPIIIIAKTLKGYGLASIEGKQGFHGKAFSYKELPELLQELYSRFKTIADAKNNYAWHAKLPQDEQPKKLPKPVSITPQFKKGELVATRKAYGLALVELGKQLNNLVSLDAEVKNSTFAELFEKEFPSRFVQCFIAEQNMVSMGVGFASRGKIPFISTFACFFTRAYDQIRMAAIGQAALRLVGSHVGVSIGEDGPSQMGLEDIAMMRAIPNAVVLYPADAVAAYALLTQMANRNNGISYMRTTRAATPVIYDSTAQFTLGGCHILRQSKADKVCIIAAGITLFEALKAYDMVASEKIAVAVIDAYSIQPLAKEEIARVVKSSGNKVITVEDHYPAGGLGEAVAMVLINEGVTFKRLAVNHMPRSGTPEELLAYEEINAESIVKAIKGII